MSKQGFPNLCSSVDALLHCGLPSQIYYSFQYLCSLLQQLGLAGIPKKLEPPTTVSCLGIMINTETNTMSVTC